MDLKLCRKQITTKNGATFYSYFCYPGKVEGNTFEELTLKDQSSLRFKFAKRVKGQEESLTYPCYIRVTDDEYFLTYEKAYNSKEYKLDQNGNKRRILIITDYVILNDFVSSDHPKIEDLVA